MNGDERLTGEPPEPPATYERRTAPVDQVNAAKPPRAVIPNWVQLVLLPLALLAVWATIRAAGRLFLIFVVAAIIALILNPAVNFLKRPRLPRGLAVLAVYLAFFLTLAGVGFLLANPISKQVSAFAHNLPALIKEANEVIAQVERKLNQAGFHVHIAKQGKTALQTLQEKIAKSSSQIASSFGALLTEIAGAAFNLVIIFVVSVYMLLYGERIGALVRRVMPEGDGTPGDDYPTLVQNALARYVGGQLLFSLIMGATAGLALYVFGLLQIFPDGRKYAVAFGAFVGLMELIPYIGPILGAIPPILVAFLTDPISAVWVALLFLGLQQLEGHVVAPQIFGHTLRINPLLVIFALLFGESLYGIVGALVALPVLSILRETIVYLGRHIELEKWNRSADRVL